MDKLSRIYEDTKNLVKDRNKLNLFMKTSVETLLPSFTRKDIVQLNTLLDSWIITHFTYPTRTPYNGLPEIIGIFEQDLKNKGFIVTEKKLHLLVKLLLISYIKAQTSEFAIFEDMRKDTLRQLFIAQTQEPQSQQPAAAQELSTQELSAQAEREALQQAIQSARELEAQKLARRELEARELAARQQETRELAARQKEARELAAATTNLEPRRFLQQYQAAQHLRRELSKKKQDQSQLQFIAAQELASRKAPAATNLKPRQTLRQYQEAREQTARELSLRQQAQSQLQFQAARELLAREAQSNNDEAEIRGRQKNPYSKKTRDRSRDGDSELGDLSSREIDNILEYGSQPHSSVARASDHPDMYTGLPQSAYQYPDSSTEFNADLVDDKGDPDFDAYYGNQSLGGKVRSNIKYRFKPKSNKQKNNKKKGIKRKSNKRKSNKKKGVKRKTIRKKY